jgi:glycerophosphoryl diester phosphodiesterase
LSDSKFNIWGHRFCRGTRGNPPENTIPALREAIRQEVDGVEFDVRLTADDVAVVFHDRDLNDWTEGKGRVRHTKFEDLRQLNVFNKTEKAVSHHDPIIPTLTEVLDKIEPHLSTYCGAQDGRHFKVNIEIKGKEAPHAVAEEVKRRLASGKWSEKNFHISGFKLDRLHIIREQLPSIEIGALYTQNLGERLGYRKVYGLLDRAFKEMEKIGAGTINLPIEYYSTHKIAEKIRKAGYQPVAWTYKEKLPNWQSHKIAPDIRRIVEDEITIITDYPKEMRVALKEAAQHIGKGN